MTKQLMRGSHVLAEAAVRAGCRYYFGYPITPQNEVPEYMAGRMPEVGGVFLQAESEVASINMLIGAAYAGSRCMTSSSGPGISLMQEGISTMAGLELPAVIVNIMRGGPGLGNIAPSQADYFQATRGGGHGDYRTIVLAPASGQELCDMTGLAFDLADKYRNPAMILGDGMMGLMMEPVVLPPMRDLTDLPAKDWAITGAKGRPGRMIMSLILDPPTLEQHNYKLAEKYEKIEANEVRFETYACDDAEIVVVAYGTSARIAKGAANELRKDGIKVGLFRPRTLWPFPYAALRQLGDKVKYFLNFEMCSGQMLDDVKIALRESAVIRHFGRPGGIIPTPEELEVELRKYHGQIQAGGASAANKKEA